MSTTINHVRRWHHDQHVQEEGTLTADQFLVDHGGGLSHEDRILHLDDERQKRKCLHDAKVC